MSKVVIVLIVALLVAVGNIATYLGNAHLACPLPAARDATLQGFLASKPPLTGNGHGYQ